eukprot:932745-Amphidinium_carterae.1
MPYAGAHIVQMPQHSVNQEMHQEVTLNWGSGFVLYIGDMTSLVSCKCSNHVVRSRAAQFKRGVMKLSSATRCAWIKGASIFLLVRLVVRPNVCTAEQQAACTRAASRLTPTELMFCALGG